MKISVVPSYVFMNFPVFEVNKCLFLTVNKISEKMYCEYNVIISMLCLCKIDDISCSV